MTITIDNVANINSTVNREAKTKRRAVLPIIELFARMENGISEPNFHMNARTRRELERIEDSLQDQVGDKELKETV